MNFMQSIERDFEDIDVTASEFMATLSGKDIYRDIILSAELAGLLLLRAANADLSSIEPGSILQGIASNDAYNQLQQFIYIWCQSNGLDPGEIGDVDIPDEHKAYLPETAQLEDPFYEICDQRSLPAEYHPYIAVLAALKIVLAGDGLNLLAARMGLSLTHYHVLSGSRTVP